MYAKVVAVNKVMINTFAVNTVVWMLVRTNGVEVRWMLGYNKEFLSLKFNKKKLKGQ